MVWVLSVPASLTVCQSALSVSRAVYNNRCNVHNIFMHIHKCTNSFTASGHSNLPLAPPPRDPGRKDWNKKESPTRINNHILQFYGFFSIFIQTHCQQIYTWKGVQCCDQFKQKKSSSSPKKYCLSWSKNGKSIIVTVASMIANIHIMSNKLRPMYNVKLKQHAGKTTEPFYKTICCRERERGNVYMCMYVCAVMVCV